jgi:FixJ family two-component response regulator
MALIGAVAVAVADPESDRIGEEFCQKFYAYLRRPLDAAEDAYRRASLDGPANSERKRLDSLSMKVERVIAVLSMRIEGQTQEAIAAALGISRNQVKYIVEQVQEAYEQFAAAGARTWTRQSTAGALSHVQ